MRVHRARAADAAELANVDVVAERAESWSAGLGTRDLVTARALAPLAVLAEYAAPLLREGGALVAWKGRRDGARRTPAAPRPPASSGSRSRRSAPSRRTPGAEHRHLHVLRKVAPTPDRFPRRAGDGRKRPLGSDGTSAACRPCSPLP